MKLTIWIILSLISISIATDAQTLPSGWRYPKPDDDKGDWKDFKKEIPKPFNVRADFNGDKIVDDAWILIPTKGKAQGLFVFLGQMSGPPQVIQLEYDGSSSPQEMYLSLAEPGTYDTACGKGYWDCAAGEPAKVRLSRTGFVYAIYESAMTLYYWDAKWHKFEKVGLSD